MDDKTLYQTILGLEQPWQVQNVELQTAEEQVVVRVGLASETALRCPECNAVCPGYDHAEERRWRHLDSCQYRTIVASQIPRVKCSTHGIRQVVVPWAEERSRFTALFEALAIRFLMECSINAAAALLHTSWDEMAAIQQRAVKRGLARRTVDPVQVIGVDETSFQKRHQYVTVMIDIERDRVLWIGDDRREATLRRGWETFSLEQRANLKAVVMDMWDPFIAATRDSVPDWGNKLVIDRYHVMWHMSKAVDDVRKIEQRSDTEIKVLLKGSRFLWLRGRATRTRRHSLMLSRLLKAGLKVGRAWSIKESLTAMWDYKTERGALRFFRNWYGWAMRSQLEPVKRAARTIRHYLHSIVLFTRLRYTNARTEAMNAKIQEIKYRARGYRNRENFRMAIMFHCGRLDLNPR